MKMFYIFLRIIFIIIAIIFILILVYFTYNYPWGKKYQTLSKGEIKLYSDYLEKNESDPINFVISKFDDFSIILIGEFHRKKEDVLFVNKLIKEAHKKKGITIFAWEFGPSELQSETDELLNAETFDRKKAIKIARSNYYQWYYEEYLDIYKTIWEINKNEIDPDKKMRLLQLGGLYIPNKFDSPIDSVRIKERRRRSFDKKMPKILANEVLLKNKKAICYSGLHHAFTKFAPPIFLFRKNFDRGGIYLRNLYPDDVYQVTLHSPVPGRSIMLRELFPVFVKKITLYYPFKGVMHQVYDSIKKPFAFDTELSPFGKIIDDYSFYSLDNFSGFSLQEFCDAYVFLCSFDEVKKCSIVKDWVTDETDLKELREILLDEDAYITHDLEAFQEFVKENEEKLNFKDLFSLN